MEYISWNKGRLTQDSDPALLLAAFHHFLASEFTIDQWCLMVRWLIRYAEQLPTGEKVRCGQECCNQVGIGKLPCGRAFAFNSRAYFIGKHPDGHEDEPIDRDFLLSDPAC